MKNEYSDIADASARERAIQLLKAGGVVVLPTDTLFGLSARISSISAVRRIAAAKGTPDRTRFVVLAASIEMVDLYVRSYGCADRTRLARAWPAPLTVVLPSGGDCPAWIGDSAAFRVPDVLPLRDLIEAVGEPVISTSVNVAGQPPLTDLDDIRREFGGRVDMILSGVGQTGRASARASTIVDFTRERPEVIREGEYEWGRYG